jgi:alanine dehydrogenase
LPWALEIANRGLFTAAEVLPPIARAINICEGEVTTQAVAETFEMPYKSRFEVKSSC